MTIKSIIEENGLLGLMWIPVCLFLGHDYNIGRRCIRCHKPLIKEVEL